MLTDLQLVDFKNFADERLAVGPFTVIVGANASGKSNIRDAFRLLHGIGRGYTLADAIGGRYGVGGQKEWQEIRGALDEIVRFGQPSVRLCVGLRLPLPDQLVRLFPHLDLRYELGLAKTATGFVAVREQLSHGHPVYTTHPAEGDPVREQGDENHLLLRMAKTGSQRKYGHRIAVRPTQPALTQLYEHQQIVRSHKALASEVKEALGHMRFLEPLPDPLRQPAFPGQTVLGDNGDNLPTVLRKLCEDPACRDTLLEWTRELTPMDVADFDFPIDPTTGRVQLAIKEHNGRTVSAYAASDGTLRFLAMLAALLDDEREGLYFFEEIDNGIHPTRLRLLVDLIENRTADRIQVVTTTHSPSLLSMVSDRTFAHTSVVCRRPDSNDAVIRRVANLPNAEQLRTAQGLGRLHTSGWLEDAVYFEGE